MHSVVMYPSVSSLLVRHARGRTPVFPTQPASPRLLRAGCSLFVRREVETLRAVSQKFKLDTDCSMVSIKVSLGFASVTLRSALF